MKEEIVLWHNWERTTILKNIWKIWNKPSFHNRYLTAAEILKELKDNKEDYDCDLNLLMNSSHIIAAFIRYSNQGSKVNHCFEVKKSQPYIYKPKMRP